MMMEVNLFAMEQEHAGALQKVRKTSSKKERAGKPLAASKQLTGDPDQQNIKLSVKVAPCLCKPENTIISEPEPSLPGVADSPERVPGGTLEEFQQRWERKAAEHFSETRGQLEAQVQLEVQLAETQAQLQAAESRAQTWQSRASEAELRLQEAETRAQLLEEDVQALRQATESMQMRSEAEKKQLEEQLNAHRRSMKARVGMPAATHEEGTGLAGETEAPHCRWPSTPSFASSMDSPPEARRDRAFASSVGPQSAARRHHVEAEAFTALRCIPSAPPTADGDSDTEASLSPVHDPLRRVLGQRRPQQNRKSALYMRWTDE